LVLVISNTEKATVVRHGRHGRGLGKPQLQSRFGDRAWAAERRRGEIAAYRQWIQSVAAKKWGPARTG